MKLPQARTAEIVVQNLNGEVLVYDLSNNRAFCLNETSAIIWQLCDGRSSVGEINQTLNEKLKQSISEEIIWLALDNFKKENLLEHSEQFEINFNGLNRRQIIRKVGLASMIMLPIVSSIIAPSAANAASGAQRALCSNCSSPAQCASGNCATTLFNTCSAPGSVLGSPPGQISNGSCPTSSAFCLTNCPLACCSGSTSYSGGFCYCNPVP